MLLYAVAHVRWTSGLPLGKLLRDNVPVVIAPVKVVQSAILAFNATGTRPGSQWSVPSIHAYALTPSQRTSIQSRKTASWKPVDYAKGATKAEGAAPRSRDPRERCQGATAEGARREVGTRGSTLRS